MPEQDAVLAITSGVDIFDMQQPLTLVWDLLLPAMQPEPLPDNPASQSALTDTLSALSMSLVQGQDTSPLTSEVSGRTYAVDTNALQIETIALNFSTTSCVITIKTALGKETFPCGYGVWQRGHTTLFHQPLLFERTPVATSGAWTSDETFKMILRLYETPFFYTLMCHFIGDEMMIESQVNVSMESMAPLLLMASPS